MSSRRARRIVSIRLRADGSDLVAGLPNARSRSAKTRPSISLVFIVLKVERLCPTYYYTLLLHFTKQSFMYNIAE